MIELKDKCEYCGNKKENHIPFFSPDGEKIVCGPPFRGYLFKSTTQALAERNALPNLELLIEAKEVLDNMNQNSVDHFDAHELNSLMNKLSEAIKQSTE